MLFCLQILLSSIFLSTTLLVLGVTILGAVKGYKELKRAIKED